ncbi:MAG: type II toxin-antitoxin system RelE/ParE family toxin [Sulfurifustis sp.]
MRVVWTPEAISRLEDIEAYISVDSPTNAGEMIARLLARARQLETAALSGREVPEYRRDDIGELLERPLSDHLFPRARARDDSHGDALSSVVAAQITGAGWRRTLAPLSARSFPWGDSKIALRFLPISLREVGSRKRFEDRDDLN